MDSLPGIIEKNREKEAPVRQAREKRRSHACTLKIVSSGLYGDLVSVRAADGSDPRVVLTRAGFVPGDVVLVTWQGLAPREKGEPHG